MATECMRIYKPTENDQILESVASIEQVIRKGGAKMQIDHVSGLCHRSDAGRQDSEELDRRNGTTAGYAGSQVRI